MRLMWDFPRLARSVVCVFGGFKAFQKDFTAECSGSTETWWSWSLVGPSVPNQYQKDVSFAVFSIPKLLRWKQFCQLTGVVSWGFSVHAELLPSYFCSLCPFVVISTAIYTQQQASLRCYAHGFLLRRLQHNGAILLTALIGSIAEIAVRNIFIFTCTVLQDFLRSRGLLWSSSVTQGYACVRNFFFPSSEKIKIRILLCRKVWCLQGYRLYHMV